MFGFKGKKKPEIEFVEKSTEELYSIKVLRGRYKGAVYTYGRVKFVEVGENLILDFTFRVENGTIRYSKEELSNSTKFKNWIGTKLTELLQEEGSVLDPRKNIDNDDGREFGAANLKPDVEERIILQDGESPPQI